MYKVYVNGKPFFMGTPESTGELGLLIGKKNYHSPYLGKRKQIKQYLDLLEKNEAVESVVLYCDQPELMWADFLSCFKLIEAAGGYVTGPDERLLVFYRRGSWDLPKGKIDPGELPEEAAVREVQEETGLEDVVLGYFMLHTWHTYREKGDRILKKTWWYRMTTGSKLVTPQVEEDIEQIEWVQPKSWLATDPVVYGSIRDVINVGLQ